MTDTDTVWLAAVIDCEGCLSLRRNGRGKGFGPCLFLDHGSARLIERAEQIMRAMGVAPHRPTPRAAGANGLGRHPIYRLYLYRGLPVVLRAIAPHLHTEKREYVAALLELYSVRPRSGARWTPEQLALAAQIRLRYMPLSGRHPGARGASSSGLDGTP